MTEIVIATRAEGLRRLAEFVPRAGKPYSERRDYDNGPDRATNVSRLSAHLRYRLLLDSEVAQAVLERHTVAESRAFLNALTWRTYWRGWLEGRPQIYQAYRRACADDLRRFEATESYRAAIDGRTGVSAFDAWNRELIETGYLHHQARLSYASIWIFTLRLPWALGAAHFFAHLLDQESACNTLSWRWVAGLHNVGKHYLANAKQIARFSGDRFPQVQGLRELAGAVKGPSVPPARPVMPLPSRPSSLLGERYALLLTPDDLTVDVGQLSELRPQVVLWAGLNNLPSESAHSKAVCSFIEQALEDTTHRLAQHFDCPVLPLPMGSDPAVLLGEFLSLEKTPDLVYYQPAVGPWRELVDSLTAKDVGLRYFPVRRIWDALLYPLADKGIISFQESSQPLLLKNKDKF